MAPEVIAALKLRDDLSGPLRAATSQASSNFGALGSVALGAAAGVLAAGAGLLAFGITAVLKTAEAGQAAYQMSEKFGLAQEQASEWLTVARHLGVNADSLGSGFKFLSKNIENMNLNMAAHVVTSRQVQESSEKLRLATDKYNLAVKQHGANSDQARSALISLQLAQDHFNKITTDTTGKLGPTAQAFSVLGLNAFDSTGKMKSANEMMLEAADVFAKMPDGIEKTGLAIKIFGKQGMDMLPVLNMGRKGLEDMMKAGQLTGEVMSGPQVEASHKFFLAQQKLNSEMTGFTTMVGTALMPVAADFIAWVTGTAVPGLVAFAKPWIEQLTPTVKEFTGWLLTLGPELKKGYDIFSKMAPFILGVAAAWTIWNAALLITEGAQAVIVGVQFVAGLVAIISKVGLLTAAQWLLNLAMDANPVGLITLAIAALVAGVIWAYQNVGWFRDIVNALGGAFMAFVTQFWSDVKPIFDWIGGTLIPLLEKAWNFITNILGNSGQATAPPAGHAPGHRAGGGSTTAGESYWVGEKGPELWTETRSGYITPAGAGNSSVAVYVTSPSDAYEIAAEVGWQVQKLRRRL